MHIYANQLIIRIEVGSACSSQPHADRHQALRCIFFIKGNSPQNIATIHGNVQQQHALIFSHPRNNPIPSTSTLRLSFLVEAIAW